jgi:transcriptional regulator with XRE-family HTH domain
MSGRAPTPAPDARGSQGTPRYIAERVGDNLYRARRRAGISQEELGFGADLHRTEIGLLERGSRLARIDTLVKLAGALDIAPEALLDGILWSPARIAGGGFDVSESGAGLQGRGDG